MASTTTTAPLLRPRNPGAGAGDTTTLSHPTTLAMLLGRASGRRNNAASMLVRETAARQLEERRADWGYTFPVVFLDIVWNLAFVAASVVMLGLARDEKPNVPLRLWICGYAAQCGVHGLLVWLEYRRRNRRRVMAAETDLEAGGRIGGGYGLDGTDVEDENEDEDGRIGSLGVSNRSSITKKLESINTMASFLWWIVGFYWVVSGGDFLLQTAPRLYWLTVAFLAFDVFFAIFCVVLACLIGIALCCCLPCIIAILYAVAGQEGASEAELNTLPRYKFQVSSYDEENPGVGAGRMVPMDTSSGYLADERILLQEDADCCICLSSYEDGTELHTLPCNHHFHSTCIVKWLKMNATCPLCKYNILKGNEHV